MHGQVGNFFTGEFLGSTVQLQIIQAGTSKKRPTITWNKLETTRSIFTSNGENKQDQNSFFAAKNNFPNYISMKSLEIKVMESIHSVSNLDTGFDVEKVPFCNS